MKTLLLLLLLAACGKNEMPPEDDMRDSDGDTIPNYREAAMDKYISGIVPLQEIETEIEFQTGVSKLSSHKYYISNKLDLQKYSRDLLVKNMASLKTNDYFSEFSFMRMKPDQKIVLSDEGLVRLTLRSTAAKSSPKSVFLIYPDKKVSLGDWSPNLEINIASEDLNAVLKGEAHIAITHLTGKIAFFDKTQDDTIREKTFRVLINNGRKTDILYISKELELEEILSYFKIKSYKNIEEENLLTTAHKPLSSEWWVRRISDRDIIIVNDDLRSLSDSYLEGFEKKKLILNRNNGVAKNKIEFSKHPSANVLLKIRGFKTSVTFYTEKKHDSGNVGENRYWVCDLYYRKSNPAFESALTGEEVENSLRLNGLIPAAIHSLSDEKGSFWEVEVKSDLTNIELKLENFAQNQYLQEGLYDKKCDKNGTSGPDIKPNPRVPERSLSLSIEAFVEKI